MSTHSFTNLKANLTLIVLQSTIIWLLCLCINVSSSTTTSELSIDSKSCSTETEVFDKCDLEAFTSCEDFKLRFWDTDTPGIARGNLFRSQQSFQRFKQMSSRNELLKSDLKIKLSTSVSYTGRVYIEKNVSEYVMDDTPASRLGNETYYLFGNHDGQEWTEFLANYPRLELDDMFSCIGLDPAQSALSFGTAKGGTGVPWHFHGPGFLQMLIGTKAWFLTPFEIPNSAIRFDPNITTKAWFEDEYMRDGELQKMIQTCTLREGDVIFFPRMWRHATYNVDWSSWVSTFLP